MKQKQYLALIPDQKWSDLEVYQTVQANIQLLFKNVEEEN